MNEKKISRKEMEKKLRNKIEEEQKKILDINERIKGADADNSIDLLRIYNVLRENQSRLIYALEIVKQID